jgi:hypothetical protein
MGRWFSTCVILAALGLLVPACPGRAAVIFETSATPGPPGQSGAAIYDGQYIGVRFQLAHTVTIDQIGLRMAGFVPGSIFGAIVSLSSMSDFPDSIHPFDSPDVLATTLLPVPTGEATDVTANIGPVALPAGAYALVFGAGEFGANGTGGATTNNTPIGPQSYFFWNRGNGIYVDGGYGDAPRLYVLGVIPEPSSAAATGAVIAAAAFARGDRRRRRRQLAA